MKKIRTYKKYAVAALSVTTMFSLAACGNANEEDQTTENTPSEETEETEGPRVVTDAMGNEVEIPENPERILGSYLEDYLVTLGETPVAQWSVANGTQAYLQDLLEGVPPITSDLPPEEVASFEPDLILINDETQVESGLYDQYNQIAPTYVLGDEITNDWRKALAEIGDLLGKSEEADQALADYEALVDETKEDLQASIGDEKVAAIWYVADTYYVVSPSQSSGATLFEDLELTPANVIANLPEDNVAQWNEVTLEALAEMDADHLILINSAESSVEEILEDPVWANVPAVQEDHVYDVSRDSSWLYTGIQAHTQTVQEAKEILTK
ncbi:ABC transporter substrate-binding protein [Alkalicoccobacillus murimartini]|uniref:Iron complex transport system substrate-binding protein n=1 Tax=Alkalicoccobacillus murimartini TaxID=171685 RepID=A0ABT9YEA9_9BACI|nr:ABC transporter substrate-binding protein [Alkalicoccobacillus murimartini]MDQ0206185.1 iron complex transport system substrate-binding protein [Alkalicoccobacillus murimartini]